MLKNKTDKLLSNTPLHVLLTLCALVLLSACAGSPVSTQAPPTALPAIVVTPTSTSQPATPQGELTDLMYQLLAPAAEEAQTAVDEILALDDERFVAVFMELMRAAQIGIYDRVDYATTIAALEILSGQSFRSDWASWIEWYGQTDLEPPPGFTGWKGELLSRLDPQFGEFLQDGHPSDIRVEEIQWGGVVVDGIPALVNPPVISPDEADYLTPEEPVFGISINGEHRAYPLRILDWHEMSNDVVGGVPVSLAYCTLCGAGIAFDGRASDGTTYTFGSSGFLFRSNKLMYDHQTRTLWNQLTGEPVLGELVGTGVELDLLPVVLTSWEDWLTQHPDTDVLSTETGHNRPYELGAAYGDYFAATSTMFPVWQRSDLLDTKDRVYVLRIDGTPKAYPVDVLTEEQVVNDALSETPLVLIAARGQVEVRGSSLRNGPVAYNAGGEVRAYERGEHQFTPGTDDNTVLDGDGRTWQVTEEALIGPDGETAPRISGHLAYWFGWYAFFPNTELYGVSE